jgi:hypothetical protein
MLRIGTVPGAPVWANAGDAAKIIAPAKRPRTNENPAGNGTAAGLRVMYSSHFIYSRSFSWTAKRPAYFSSGRRDLLFRRW